RVHGEQERDPRADRRDAERVEGVPSEGGRVQAVVGGEVDSERPAARSREDNRAGPGPDGIPAQAGQRASGNPSRARGGGGVDPASPTGTGGDTGPRFRSQRGGTRSVKV